MPPGRAGFAKTTCLQLVYVSAKSGHGWEITSLPVRPVASMPLPSISGGTKFKSLRTIQIDSPRCADRACQPVLNVKSLYTRGKKTDLQACGLGDSQEQMGQRWLDELTADVLPLLSEATLSAESDVPHDFVRAKNTLWIATSWPEKTSPWPVEGTMLICQIRPPKFLSYALHCRLYVRSWYYPTQ